MLPCFGEGLPSVTENAELLVVQGVEFSYEHLGKDIPPPKDRLPSGGNYKEMPEGVMQQPVGGEEAHSEAHEYVQDLMEKASQVSETESLKNEVLNICLLCLSQPAWRRKRKKKRATEECGKALSTSLLGRKC